MSTRCHIIVKGSPNDPSENWKYIYHHHDGYPDGVGREIGEAIEEDMKEKGMGHKYTLNEVVNLITDIDDEYEVDCGMHADENYIYQVTINGDQEGITVNCYHTLPFSYNADSTTFHIDEGFEFLFQKVFESYQYVNHDDDDGDDNTSFFSKKLSEIDTVVLINMIREISDELFLRELK